MMKFARYVLFLGATLCTSLFAGDVFTDDMTGSWKVIYAGPQQTVPKTVGSILLDLRIDHGVVSGTVTIGMWPGEAPVANAKLEANRLKFTATGHLDSTTGIPTCQLDVTVLGDEMLVTLKTINNGGGPVPLWRAYEYKGTRVTH